MGRSGGGFSGGGGFGGGFSSGGFGGGFSSRGPSGGFGGGRSSRPPSNYGGGYYGGGGNGFLGGLILGQLLGGSRGGSGGGGNGSGGNNGAPNGNPSGNSGGSSSGCFTVLAIIAAILLVLIILSMFNCSGSIGDADTPSSTVERTALPSGAAEETSFYTDASGDWIGSPKVLEQGMTQFYMDTGVRPYLYILPNGSTNSLQELTDMAEDLYSEMFTDEAHFVLVFCDNNNYGFNAGYWVGAQAQSVMDAEALNIFASYLNANYYNDNLSESELFAKTYEETGDRIMTTDAERMMPVYIVGFVVVGVVIVAVIVALVIRRNRKAREAEQKRQQEILNTPLEKFGDQSVEDLAAKYEKSRDEMDGSSGDADLKVENLEKFGGDEAENLAEKYKDS